MSLKTINFPPHAIPFPGRRIASPENIRAGVARLSSGLKNEAERQLIWKTFHLASDGYQGQLRKDGSAYISHPVATAEISAVSGGDAEEIAGCLGHDLIEQGVIGGRRVTYNFLAEQLGENVARIIDAATELGKEPGAVIANPSLYDIFMHYLGKWAQEPRGFRVKLFDRLHNMRTLVCMAPATRRVKAEEALNLFCPIADILGMWQAKRELEDHSLRYLEPGTYFQLKRDRVEVFNASLNKIREIVCKLDGQTFKRANLPAEFKMEKRAVYELYERMLRHGLDRLLAADVCRLHIFVADQAACYRALDRLHETYPPVLEEMRDYVAAPRPNGHRFLHTVVNVNGFGPLVVQIRDQDMKRAYELGGPVQRNQPWPGALSNQIAEMIEEVA